MSSSLKTRLSPVGLAIIKAFEGICDGDPTTVNLDPYLDPLGIWTIGWGHAIHYNGRRLRDAADAALAKSLYPNGITLAEAKTLLADDVVLVEIYLNGVLPGLTQNEFDAVCSFVFNVGIGNFEDSTLLGRLRANDKVSAASEFGRWIYGTDKKGNKVKLPGQITRRAAERNLFLTPEAPNARA